MARAKKDGDLFLASNVDVRRGENKDGTPKIETIRGGQMVSSTGLKADEVKDLKLRGIVRVPTQAESDAMDAQADAEDAAAAQAQAETAAQQLAQEQENERQRLAAEQEAAAEEERQKLAAQQEKERLAAEKKK